MARMAQPRTDGICTRRSEATHREGNKHCVNEL